MKKRKIHLIKCASPGCDTELRVRQDAFKLRTGFCKTHSHTKRPFESLYNGLFRDHRKLEVSLTYEEYLDFTKENKCHYCSDEINWEPYGTVSGKFISRAYYLDRKDLNLGYSKQNCVVCCTSCNKLRSNRFTYEEFLLLATVLRQILINRRLK